MSNMKFFILLNLFFISLKFSNCENSISPKTKSFSNLVEAVVRIINKTYVRGVAVTHLVSPETLDHFLIKDFKDELLAKLLTSPRVLFRQDTSTELKFQGRFKRYNVFIIKDYQEFLRIYLKTSPDVFRFNGYYLVTLVNGKIPEVGEIFDLLWKIHIYNVIVIFEVKNGSVLVETFMPFQATNCSDTSPVLVNEFKDGSFIKGLKNLFPEKMKNLHKCQIRLSIANDQKPFVVVEKLWPNGTHKANGQCITLIETLSERLNFKINYTFVGPAGYIIENGSASGAFKALLDGVADMSITNWWLNPVRSKFFDSSTSYASGSIHFIIPPGKDLSAFDKLIFPFKTSVWILILLCFVVGFLVIFITRRQTKVVQNFVFGNDVKNHYLNLFIGFIGGAQTVLPRRNFARFLLMSFLLYSLVIRNLYQASYYKFSQSNKHHKKVQSVEEMANKDFKFYVYEGIAEIFSSTEVVKNRSA